MKDVAKLANVSISTVSRVINGTIRVESDTEQRVREAIAELKYKPNLLASGLRSKSGKMIALIVPEFVPPFYQVVEYAEKTADALGFNLLVINTSLNPEKEEETIDMLIRRHVDGILFSRVSDESRVIEKLSDSDLPIVLFDRARHNERSYNVVLNNEKAGRIAGEYFYRNGHREIAVITGSLNIEICRDRLDGFRQSLGEHGILLDEKNIYEGDFTFYSGINAAEYFCSSELGITAIWSQNDNMAIGALQEFTRRGIKVPETLSLMGMDDIQFSQMVYPPLTTIAQPFKKMIEDALHYIVDSIDGTPPSAGIREVLEPRLIVRKSTKNIDT